MTAALRVGILFDREQPVLVFAAQELKNYLERICPVLEADLLGTEIRGSKICEAAYAEGRRILLEVREPLLAQAPAGPAKPDAALDDVMEVSIAGLDGYIAGSNPRSVLLGVYRYLYSLGCRFLRPGREYEILPSLTEYCQFDSHFIRAADNRHRGVCIEGADSAENVLDFIDWLPKLGFNGFFLQFQNPYAFLKRWYEHTGNPLLEEQPFDLKDSEELSGRFRVEMKKRGLLQHWVGHGWTSEALGESALGWVKSGGSLNPEVKEFPALVNGKREYYCGIPINTNLCYSNPEVIKRYTEAVADYAQANPGVDYLHVWLADDCNNQCECERCAQSSPTDLYLHILNELDRELAARKLKTRIVFLLYMELLWPPCREKLENPERYLMMFAPISRTFMQSYRQRDKLRPIPEYRRNRIVLPSGLEENLAFLQEWQKAFRGDSFVYDYHLGRAHYGDLGYVGISRVLYEDIHTLRELGLNGYMSCQELRAALPNALPNYVMGLALMDEGLSFEEIVQDYYRNAYGSSWKSCLNYLIRLSELSDWDYFNKKGSRLNNRVVTHMKEAVRLLERVEPVLEEVRLPEQKEPVLEAVRLLERVEPVLEEVRLPEREGSEWKMAVPAAGENPQAQDVRKRFWTHLSYHNRFARLLAEALSYLAAGEKEAAEEAWERFVGFIRENEEVFQKCLDVYRIIEVGTNYAGFPKINK